MSLCLAGFGKPVTEKKLLKSYVGRCLSKNKTTGATEGLHDAPVT